MQVRANPSLDWPQAGRSPRSSIMTSGESSTIQVRAKLGLDWSQTWTRTTLATTSLTSERPIPTALQHRRDLRDYHPVGELPRTYQE